MDSIFIIVKLCQTRTDNQISVPEKNKYLIVLKKHNITDIKIPGNTKNEAIRNLLDITI